MNFVHWLLTLKLATQVSNFHWGKWLRNIEKPGPVEVPEHYLHFVFICSLFIYIYKYSKIYFSGWYITHTVWPWVNIKTNANVMLFNLLLMIMPITFHTTTSTQQQDPSINYWAEDYFISCAEYVSPFNMLMTFRTFWYKW